MVKNLKIEQISLDGGTLCMDFINSVHNRKEEIVPDYLDNIFDLIAWAEKAGAIDAKKSKQIEGFAIEHPKKAEHFFKDALALRELLYIMFKPVSEGKKINAEDLGTFNKHLTHYFSFLQLKQQQGVFTEDWNLPAGSLYYITAPVVNDAYELLLSGKSNRIKACPNCGWLFLDTTKNGKRRWCSMKSCGSSVKALEWYYRNK